MKADMLGSPKRGMQDNIVIITYMNNGHVIGQGWHVIIRRDAFRRHKSYMLLTTHDVIQAESRVIKGFHISFTKHEAPLKVTRRTLWAI